MVINISSSMVHYGYYCIVFSWALCFTACLVLWNPKAIYLALMNKRAGYVKEERNWAEILPKEVLGMVFRRLTLPDHVRAGAVCRWWRLVIKESIHHYSPMPQLPWLMMIDQYYGDHTRFDSTVKFYSLSEERYYTISLPSYALCTGSYLGWMMIHRRNQTFLLNPISGIQIALPIVSTHWLCSVKGFKEGAFLLSAPFSLEKSPTSCLVVGVTSCGELAYCMPGDVQWSEFKATDGTAFLALAFHKECLYVLDSNGDLVVFQINNHLTRTKLGILHPVNREPNFFMDDHKYLVSRGEDLLLVLKRRSRHEVPGANHPRFSHVIRTDNFEIFKLDWETYRWVEMDSLGNHILFWGIGHLISLSASEIRGARGDCIYFMEPNIFGHGQAMHSDSLKNFKMEDRCIEPYLTGDSHFFPKGCTWFTPYQ